jgi:aspartyl-tRNA(Asn)/glutamyl-tRNA(Gln) amidotransferase subunit B
VQREKEDAHDYRYFPEPDLLPVVIDQGFVSAVKAGMPRLPGERRGVMMREYGLSLMEAEALTQEREDAEFFEASVREAMGLGVEQAKAGRGAANLLLQSGMKRLGTSADASEANAGGDEDASGDEATEATGATAEQARTASAAKLMDLGITARGIASIVHLRDGGEISAGKADELFGVLCEMGASAGDADARKIAQERGWLLVKDTGAMEAWVTQAIEQQPQAAADVKAGKDAAIGRIVGAAMKASGGQGDAAGLREMIVKRLRG